MSSQKEMNSVVLKRLKKMNDTDGIDTDVLADAMNMMLDEIENVDGFGDDSKHDPRGDGSDFRRTMFNVDMRP